MRSIFWSYLFWDMYTELTSELTTFNHLNCHSSSTALGTRAINELIRLLQCKWKMKLPQTLLKNCADTSITGWKMAVPNVTLECHPHVCCSQQGETVWMMEKYASTYRQEMGWCLRILSSNIIQCSKGIGSKNGTEKKLDRQLNGQTDIYTLQFII